MSVQIVIRWILSICFILSGTFKLISIHAFEYEIIQFEEAYLTIFNFLNPLTTGIIICLFELLLGVDTILHCLPIFTGYTMCLIMCFFTYLTGMNLFFPPIDGQIESCGCFGEIIKFTPLTSFAKSVILLSISVIHLLYELKVLPIISKKESTHHTSLFTKFKCHFMLILFLSFISCKPNTKKHTSHGQVTYDNGVIYSDNVVYDFGDIKGSSNDTIPFTFNLTNKSEHVLTIEKVEASCPCVSVSSYAKEITAGQATKLSGNIDISKTKGKLNKPIFVRYNDGQIMILRIKGIVR